MRGTVDSIKDNFGFIKAENGQSYYFNKLSMDKGFDFSSIKGGENVEFDVEKLANGKTRASNCKIIENKSIVYFREKALKLHEIEEEYDVFCDYALEYADRLKTGKVTTSMIRKIYARILAADKVMEVKMLRPQFAYTSGRNDGNLILREFMELLDDIVKSMNIDNPKELDNFKQFMEAIVAYRKYVGDDK